MEIETKHIDVILRSKIKIVDKLSIIASKLEYGENIDCVNNLYAAILLINRLECYSFTTPNYNCIKEEDLPKYYEVLFDLLNK